MALSEQEAYKKICQSIRVTRQDVVIAESYLFKTTTPDTGPLIKQFDAPEGHAPEGQA